jgi:hypothetical protein
MTRLLSRLTEHLPQVGNPILLSVLTPRCKVFLLEVFEHWLSAAVMISRPQTIAPFALVFPKQPIRKAVAIGTYQRSLDCSLDGRTIDIPMAFPSCATIVFRIS